MIAPRLGDAAKRPQGLNRVIQQVAGMAGDNAVVIKRIKKGGHGGHHGGAWKVAYADFVTAMMAFFLLMWLINTTTPEQKRGIADYFAPQSIAQTVSGSRRRAGRQGDGRRRCPCRRRPVGDAETVAARALLRHQGAGQRRDPGRRQCRISDQQCQCPFGAGRRLRPCRRSHPSGDAGQSRHRQSLASGDHREHAARPAHPAGGPGRPAHVPAGLQRADALYQEAAGGGRRHRRHPAQPGFHQRPYQRQ